DGSLLRCQAGRAHSGQSCSLSPPGGFMNRLSRRTALIAAAAGLAALAAPGPVAAEAGLRLTKPINATSFNVDPDRTYSAPVFIVDPENSSTILASYFEMRSKR